MIVVPYPVASWWILGELVIDVSATCNFEPEFADVLEGISALEFICEATVAAAAVC